MPRSFSHSQPTAWKPTSQAGSLIMGEEITVSSSHDQGRATDSFYGLPKPAPSRLERGQVDISEVPSVKLPYPAPAAHSANIVRDASSVTLGAACQIGALGEDALIGFRT